MNRQLSKIRAHCTPIRATWAIALVGLVCIGIAGAAVSSTHTASKSPEVAALSDLGNAFSAITENVAPAVVYIHVEKNVAAVGNTGLPQGLPDWFGDEQLRRFFGDQLPNPQGPQPRHRAEGQGSGFIISEDGHILTNNHVVGGADRMKVTLADGREFDAKIVGTDERTDVAVIKIEGKDLPVLPMGDSDQVKAGQWVLAVGSPFGLPGTVTSGIVSATGRNSVGITDYENFIQTDAAINPGNSGGPLVDLNGQAIGINTAIYSRSGGYMGIGFAIPINMARDVCDQLIHSGTVTRGYLGIAIQPLTADLAKSFGLDDTAGVLVGDVTPDSPADKAGFQSGDVIVRFDGQAVEQVGAFRNRVARTAPDKTVAVEVTRDGKPVELFVTLGTLPGQDELANNGVTGHSALGLAVQELNHELADQLGYTGQQGVVITAVEPDSRAAEAGLEPGMLIKQVNRDQISGLKDYREAIRDAKDKDRVLLLVQKGEYSRYVTVSLDD